jgi:hypothetical protein
VLESQIFDSLKLSVGFAPKFPISNYYNKLYFIFSTSFLGEHKIKVRKWNKASRIAYHTNPLDLP